MILFGNLHLISLLKYRFVMKCQLQTYLDVSVRASTNKKFSKAIMDRSHENRFAYNQQRNFCVSLIRKTKLEYFSNLNQKNFTDNKLFWNTIKPFFSDKGATRVKYTLIEDDEIIADDRQMPSVFMNFFSNIVSNLNIPQYEDPSVNLQNINDPIEKIRKKHKNHLSILAILQQLFGKSFSFQITPKEHIEKEMLSLNETKASQKSDLLTTIIKMNIDMFCEILRPGFYKAMELCQFLSYMKMVNVPPVYEKGSRSVKDNYRPVSTLPNLSNIFERCLYKQVSPYFDNILSRNQCVSTEKS